ncbi:MAG: M60 family metallopeptidase [Planctomycetota bacterium]|jgi:hypothetical protein
MRIALAVLLAASFALADDRAKIVEGVTEIGAPGVPGPLCVFGKNAFVVCTGGWGKNLAAPVVAATYLVEGRVVAFGHGGYLGKGALETGDTARLVRQCAAWANGGSKAAKIYAYRLPAIVDKLGATPWKGDAIPADCGVLVIDVHWLGDKKRFAMLDDWVRAGGGLVTASLGWGWKQVTKKDLRTRHAGNRLLRHAGIVWADGYLKRTTKDGYAVQTNIAPGLHARTALASKGATPQSVSTLTTALHALPLDDMLFLPDLNKALEGVSFEDKKQVRLKDGLARVAFAAQIQATKRLPPEEVKPHPWARRFPGVPKEKVKPRARPTVIRRVIDTSIPRWHSTGAYALPGTVIRVTLPPELQKAGLAVRIGSHSDKLWHKPAWQRAPEVSRRWPLTQGITKVASAFGGLVYIEVPKNAKPATHDILIGNVIPAPLFILGETRLSDWDRIRKRPGPWAEIGTDRLIITVPSRVIREMATPVPVLNFWNDVLDGCADLAARPRRRTSPERFVVDKQISAGYMHSGYPLMAHLDAAAWLPNIETRTKGNWGLFHEIGHNHQHRDWTFGGTTEVTVNLFTLYVYENVCRVENPRGNLYGEHRKKTIRGYIQRGRQFSEWKSKPFLALLMYMQLQEAFGWKAYKELFKKYRELAPEERPKNDNQKRDQWMVRFSRHVGKNLGPFFEAWGVPTSEEAREAISDLPDWMPEDWPKDK